MKDKLTTISKYTIRLSNLISEYDEWSSTTDSIDSRLSLIENYLSDDFSEDIDIQQLREEFTYYENRCNAIEAQIKDFTGLSIVTDARILNIRLKTLLSKYVDEESEKFRQSLEGINLDELLDIGMQLTESTEI